MHCILEDGRKSLTLVHKGTSSTHGGRISQWGYELIEAEFADQTYTWMQWQRTAREQGEEAPSPSRKLRSQAGRSWSRT